MNSDFPLCIDGTLFFVFSTFFFLITHCTILVNSSLHLEIQFYINLSTSHSVGFLLYHRYDMTEYRGWGTIVSHIVV